MKNDPSPSRETRGEHAAHSFQRVVRNLHIFLSSSVMVRYELPC